MLAAVASLAGGCDQFGGSSPPPGGVTIPETDGSAPTIALTVTDERLSAGVDNGGSAATMALTRKTGPLYLVTLGRDNESGVREIQIFVTTYKTSCDQDLCSTEGPLRSADPNFKTNFPAKSPGETTSTQTVFLETLELAEEIPQGTLEPGESLTVDFEIYAVAINHLGGRSETAGLTVTWSESAP